MILYPDRLVEVGQLRKSHGVDGALRANIEPSYREFVWDTEFLFLELDGDHVPFRIEYIKGDEDAPIFKFTNVDTPEEASRYTGIGLFMEKENLPASAVHQSPSDLEYGFLEGYTMYDEVFGLVGRILDVEEYPQQEMAVVNFRESEILVPLHADLILRIDEEERKVTMALPEGVLEQ